MSLSFFFYNSRASAKNLQIRAGSSSSQNGGDLYQVGDFVWNPAFTYSKMDSDVAVLWLDTPLEFSDSVAPVPMFDAGEEISDGDLTVVSGWGNTRVSVNPSNIVCKPLWNFMRFLT